MHGVLNRVPLEFFGEALTKFPSRSIAYVLKTVWGNLAHREALKKETQCAKYYICLLVMMLRSFEEYRQICSIRQLDDQRRHLSHG